MFSCMLSVADLGINCTLYLPCQQKGKGSSKWGSFYFCRSLPRQQPMSKKIRLPLLLRTTRPQLSQKQLHLVQPPVPWVGSTMASSDVSSCRRRWPVSVGLKLLNIVKNRYSVPGTPFRYVQTLNDISLGWFLGRAQDCGAVELLDQPCLCGGGGHWGSRLVGWPGWSWSWGTVGLAGEMFPLTWHLSKVIFTGTSILPRLTGRTPTSPPGTPTAPTCPSTTRGIARL